MDFPALEKTNALDFFSEYGKKIFNPTGIFYWTGRSKTEAKINATIGSAKGRSKDIFEDGDDQKITLCIPSIKEYFPDLSTEEIFPYAPEVGIPAFRDAWKEWLLKKAEGDADRIAPRLMSPMIVPGITGGISICTRMFVDPGTPIIVPDKRWENYDNVFLRNIFCEIEEYPTFDGQDYNLNGMIASIKKVWGQQDRAVVMLNFPNNPTGYCPPKTVAQKMVKEIQDLVSNNADKKLVMIFDDAYEGYVYDKEAENRSLFYSFDPAPNFLPVKMDGISKEMLWYGARVGAVTLMCPDQWFEQGGKDEVCKEIENKFRGVVRNTVSNCSRVAQVTALKALKNIDKVIEERSKVFNLLAERYQITKDELGKLTTDLLVVDPFQGGFFCFVNINPKSGLKSFDVCDHLLKKYAVGAVPIEDGDINGIRLAFCGVESQDIPEMCQSLEKAVIDLAK